ncbi:TonB-dependent siderophore receptor (plasmid) [Diaphorobacter sp. HDW4B]|uniref:TonB-dependent siderophore receptor n=1 Tax=Diaphorobacter sp. HDW4B TaxID=2714925 RepID=UPI00140B4361|nr:TonB-dependent siderophore receptor [Diaphorobacter sp. HDW4B]QIL74332.1 TonB-dependent siderophore receptor [Diaphorobacter sp. HDW4B]
MNHRLFRPAPLALALALALAWSAAPLCAQTPQASQAPATMGAEVPFQLEAQPLAKALNHWARQTRMQLFVQQSLVAGKQAPAVSGMLSPRAALDRLLAGSGLQARIDGSLVTIEPRPQPTSGERTLQTVEVTARADGEVANGPVLGYVAKRSLSATKTDTPLMETPMTIHVVSKEQIESQGTQQLTQTLRYTPGLSADIRGDTSRFDMMAFRGIGGVSDTFLYLDGLRLPRGASYLVPQIDTHSLERVEVLKGPASVMYGQAPLGGIVSMVSKRPTQESFKEVSVSAGSHNRQQMSWDSGGSLNEDGTLQYRLTAFARKSDTSVDMTKEERIYIAPSITWKPHADTQLTVLGLYQHDPKGGFYGVLPSAGSILPNPNGAFPRSFFDGSPDYNKFDRTQSSLGYEFSHRFDEAWSLKQNLRYWHMKLDQNQVGSTGLQADQHTLNRYALWSREKLNAINVDTHLQGKLQTGAVAHQLLLGLDLQHDRWQQTQGYGAAPTLDYLNPDYQQAITMPKASTSPDRTQNLVGLYVQDQLKWGGWGLTLGVRHDRARVQNDNQLTKSFTQQELSKFTWRAGLIHNFDNGFAPYVSYATSFDPSVTANPYGAPFKPTTGKQAEVGIKYQPPGHEALFTLSAFDLTQQNVLTADPTSSLPNARVQTGEVNSRGIELEARFSPARNLNVIAGLSVIDPEVTRSNGADLGKRPITVAKNTATVWADYKFTEGALAGWTAGAGIRHVGSAFADPANQQRIPAYTVMDAMLRYDLQYLAPSMRGAMLSFNVTNMADKTFFTCNGVNFCNYGQGRTFLATLKYGW